MVDLYVSNGADVNIKDNDGRTPLDIVVDADDCRESVEEALRKHGAKLSNPQTVALLNACKKGDFGEVILLYEKGVDIDACDSRGRTPLHIAAENGREDIVDYLLRKRAWPNPIDKEGRTPLDCAETAEVKKCLLSQGAKTGRELQEKRK
jgi:ankyrin repeat protein